MTRQLPPTADQSHLSRELQLVRTPDKDDALQEAWVAHLEGRNPARAVSTFAQRELRRRHREVAMSNLQVA